MISTAAVARHFTDRLRSDAAARLAWSMAAAIVSRLGLLLLAIAVGRMLGPEEYGAFTFATGLAMFVAMLSTLGWPVLMNRLIPEMLRDRDWDALRGLRDAGDAVVIGASVLAAGLLLGISLIENELSAGFLLAAVLIVPYATAALRRQQLAALRRPAIGLFFDQGFGALVATAFLLLFGVGSIVGAALVFAGGMVLGNLFTFIHVRRLLPRDVSAATRNVRFGAWMGMALPMLLGISSRQLMRRVDILMLAPMAGLYESGLYGAAFRITFLLSFPQMVLMSVATPMIGHAFAHGQHQRVTRLARIALLFAGLTTIPCALALILFPNFVLTNSFGAEFAAAAPALMLLTIGQTTASLAIPLTSLLTMGGRERLFGGLSIAGLVLHSLLNLLLIPRFGATGAATATAMVFTLLALGQLVLCWKPVMGKPW